MTAPRSLILAIEISNPSSGPRGRIDPARPTFVAGPSVALGNFSVEAHSSAQTHSAAPILIDAEPLSESTRHDDDLMPAIARLCARSGIKPRDLTDIAISIGPGGYTSLRIAVATAKMLAEATGAQLIAIPSALVAAFSIPPTPPTLIILASKGETAWAEFIPLAPAHTHAPRQTLGIITADQIEPLNPKQIIADRFLPAPMRAVAERLHATITEPIFAAEHLLHLARTLPPVDPLALTPLYPREPEAVTQWRKRSSSR